MHTPLCGHAVGSPTDYVDTAARNGVDLITFTCHIPMREDRFSQTGIRMRREEIPAYREMVREAAAHGESLGVEVLYGIEAEIHPDRAAMEDMQHVIDDGEFDFVLGSLHHMLPAFRHWLADKGYYSDTDKIRAYFDCLAEGAASGRYDSLSHPDVIRVYSTLDGSFVPEDHREVIESFLDVVAASGTCLEINTSGLIKGDFIAHPDPLIMKWALGRGIAFTFGSDSHSPDRVGHWFDEAVASFGSMGLDRLQYFRKREARTLALDGVLREGSAP
jgi:histidinol-phosphatase (PHP family)